MITLLGWGRSKMLRAYLKLRNTLNDETLLHLNELHWLAIRSSNYLADTENWHIEPKVLRDTTVFLPLAFMWALLGWATSLYAQQIAISPKLTDLSFLALWQVLQSLFLAS
jgi:hypothetical protein